jgi:biotin carboxylase
MTRPRVLLLMPKATYRADLFLGAAARLGAEVRIGSDRCHVLAEQWGVPLALPFDAPEEAARRIVDHARAEPFAAIVSADDGGTVIASLAAAALGLRANAPAAAHAARNKAVMREKLRAAGLPHPPFAVLPAEESPDRFIAAAAAVGYPLVVKPLLLSGSRGVMRADDDRGLAAAVERLRPILRSAAGKSADPAGKQVLLEQFIPGREYAVEGLIAAGGLRTLAVFDKPDPLDGPFFEETIYVTPSRLPEDERRALTAATAAAAAAIGLTTGPVHAELRAGPDGVFVIEVAPRSIGGLCSKTLHFATGVTLEELVLADALGMPPPPNLALDRAAAGVLMIPIPRRGILREVKGIDAALAVPGIESVEITAKTDHEIVPLPEGASYLGFIFARGEAPEEVEAALRLAHGALEIVIAPNLAARG